MPLVSRFVRYAPKAARYLLTSLADNLPGARRLVVTAPLSESDGGDGGDYTVSIAGASTTTRGTVMLAGQLGGTADAPDVRGIVVMDGTEVPLTFGTVGPGQALVRSGTTVVGVDVLDVAGGTMTGDIAMGGHRVTGLGTGTAPADAATYGQLTAMVNGLDWQASVLDRDQTAPPGSPVSGERHLIAASATGAWNGKDGQITTYDGAAWQFTVPNQGMTVHVEDEGIDLHYNGSVWVNIGASVDHASLLNLGAGDPHPQYQLESGKDANNGYAGLDSSGHVTSPVVALRAISDPGSPTPGMAWVNGAQLKYQDNGGTSTLQVVERQSNRGQPNGYAGLDSGGKVSQPPAVHAGSHGTGGTDAVSPASIGAALATRTVSPGIGLAGGGDLTADRTLSIAAFTGFVAKDHDPGSQSWSSGQTIDLLQIDAGANGALLPLALRLPATTAGNLVTAAVFEFHGSGSATIENTSSGSDLDLDAVALASALLGTLSGGGANDGKTVKRVVFRGRSTSGAVTADLGAFRLRAFCCPRGGGSAP